VIKKFLKYLKFTFSDWRSALEFLVACAVAIPLVCFTFYDMFIPRPVITNSDDYAITCIQYNAGTDKLYDVTAVTDLEQAKEIISHYNCIGKRRHQKKRYGDPLYHDFENFSQTHYLKIDGTLQDEDEIRTFRIILLTGQYFDFSQFDSFYDINVLFETTQGGNGGARQKILNSEQLTAELVALIVEGVEQQ